jgi:RAB protein geranylgeranyltransferase component A
LPLEIDKHVDLFPDDLAFKKYSRKFNIDLAPKILFSKS